MATNIVAGFSDEEKHDVEWWAADGRHVEYSGISMALAHAHVGSLWPVLCDGLAGHFEFWSDEVHHTMFVPGRIN